MLLKVRFSLLVYQQWPFIFLKILSKEPTKQLFHACYMFPSHL